MAVSDVQAVLEFLRKNGFSEAESALKEDMVEKVDLGSLDYEKFLFPMVPPPPPVRIPSRFRRLEALGGDDNSKSSSRSSEDEFVSLGSSTSDVCSSEFTNPYGIHSTSQDESNASSDGLSQFGTARDYHEFDMQNDLYWYHDKDDGYFMTPTFQAPDLFCCQTEDKFIMTETEKLGENSQISDYNYEGFQAEGNNDYLDKTNPFHLSSMEDENQFYEKDNYRADKNDQPLGGFLENPEDCTNTNGFVVPSCKCCADAGESYCGDHAKGSDPSLKVVHLSDFQLKVVEDTHAYFDSFPEHRMIINQTFEYYSGSDWDKGFKESSNLTVKVAEADPMSNQIYNYEVGNDGKLSGECEEPEASGDGNDAAVDELLMYDTHGDEYEVFDLRIIHRKNRTGFEENKDFPIVLNTVIAGRYYVTEYLGSAAFSKVIQAHDLHTGTDVCLKIIKNDKDFFDQSLDEIKLLKFVNKNDPVDECHILRLYDYFYHQEHLFIVCELLRANLYEFQKFNQESGGEAYFTLNRLQVITRQCLEALEYLHSLGIIHCDLKPENILIKSYKRCEIKVIDLGSSCFQSDNLCLYVQSRSYRAPEVILGLPYDQKIDIWSLGCILAELCSGEVLFPNDAIVMILARMIGMLGPIDVDMLVRGQETHKYFKKINDLYFVNEETNELEYIIPVESSLEHHLLVTDVKFIDFIKYLLKINPKRRPTAKQALEHPWLSHVYNSK
ncbi:Kinase family protein [Quillaja saponaria]|uniref:Kinase family protein n=1 Tax=Quillaja saponaria TaxID=32244 RepID=A0AAD7LK61_QUISA|nr:Kinase family protein [Quillaja saponaria]